MLHKLGRREMKRFIRLILLDYKEMSGVCFIPIVLILALTIYGSIMFDPRQPVLVLNMFQQLIPPLASWWIIMSFYSFVEDESGEAFFTYGFSRKVIGIGRVCVMIGLFSMLIVLVCTTLMLTNKCSIIEIINILLVLWVQSWFYGVIGFLLIVVIKKILWSFAVIMMILYLNIWGGLTPLSRYLIVTVEMQKSIDIKEIWLKLVSVFSMTIFFLIIAQVRFTKFRFRARK